MNAPAPIDVFKACAEKRALWCVLGETGIADAVDGLQYYAEKFGLVAELGQDRVQDVMAAAFIWAREEVRAGADDDSAAEYIRNLVRQWELNDPRDAWKWTGDRPPPDHVRNSDIVRKPANQARLKKTAASLISEFDRLVALGEPDSLAGFLRDHIEIAPILLDRLSEAA